VGGLPGALDADEHEDVLPPRPDLQGDGLLADEGCEGVVDDLDYVLLTAYPRGELLVEGPFLDVLAELHDELDVDVRLEERPLEVAYKLLDELSVHYGSPDNLPYCVVEAGAKLLKNHYNALLFFYSALFLQACM